MTDDITYQLPMGRLGLRLGGGKARRTIESMFAFRHRRTRDDLSLLAGYRRQPMTVAISGATGLVGRELSSLLTLLGHQTRRLVRGAATEPDQIAAWQNDASETQAWSEVDAVVHLAGKSIATQRWTADVKRQIRASRVDLTRQLCESLARLPRKPRVLVCASAIGIYGDRGDEELDEHAPADESFLAEVAREWEEACDPARDAGIRVVHARLGIVLSPRGGALTKMLLPARLAGGSLGSGRQWWSWICIDDVVGGIYHALARDDLEGAVNFVAPEPVRNREFARTLGGVLGRPALFPAPKMALRAALGEMADALLLTSARVVPEALLRSGYTFRFTTPDSCLRYLLGRDRLESTS